MRGCYLGEHYNYDICIIGAGVIGCSVAAALSALGLSTVIIESSSASFQGISSRNSEVIHSGLYYPPGSLKAELCVAGRRMLYDIANRRNIPHRRTGKLIVATDQNQEQELETYRLRGIENGVLGLEYLTARQISELSPLVQGTLALLVPEAGIIDSHSLCSFYLELAKSRGSDISFRTNVYYSCVKELLPDKAGWKIVTGQITETKDSRNTIFDFSNNVFPINSRYVINAAGLHSDQIASLAGIDIDAAGYRQHWVKGNYFSLGPRWRGALYQLVYPLPEKNLRGVGIHTTIDIAGQVRLGPDVEEIDRVEDYSVSAERATLFFESARRYLPSLTLEELTPSMSGIRPKLSRAGEPARDFIIAEESTRGLPGLINLIGIESPGLTSSPAIAQRVAAIVSEQLGIPLPQTLF